MGVVIDTEIFRLDLNVTSIFIVKTTIILQYQINVKAVRIKERPINQKKE